MKPDQLPRVHRSPLRFLITIVIAIFAAEVMAMIVVYWIEPLPYYVTTLIDAALMTALIFPVLYYLSFQPLIRQMEKSQRAEEMLLRSRDLQEKFFNSLDTLIAYMDRDFNFIQVNNAYARADAQEPEFFGGKNHFALYPNLENEAIFRRVVETGDAFQVYEKPFEYPDHPERGALYWDWRLQPVRASDGSVEGLVLSLVNVTERKRDHDVIRQLSRIVEQTEDTVVVTNCDGVIEYVNPAFERLTGYAREETLGNNPRVLKSGLHDQEFYRNLWSTILRGDVFQSELANRKKNGELYYEVKTITPLRDARGNITHFVATGKDITTHKQDEERLQRAYAELELRVQARTEELRLANGELAAEVQMHRQTEEALLRSESGLKRAQEIAHLGNWELDLRTNRLAWSDEVYRIFGLQPREFRASYEAFLEIVHPDDRAAVDEAYSSSVRDGKDGYEIEHRVVRPSSGEIRIVHEKCEHFRDESGQIVRSVGMVHDITERKQAEQQIRYQAAVLSNLNDAIVASDAQFRITAWNAAAESLYGWKAEEVLGRSGVELVRTEWIDQDPAEMRRAIAEAGRWRGEATQLRKDGTRFPVEISSMILRDDRGQITDYISVNRDITERKRAEAALRRSEALLLETGEMARVGGWELDLQDMTPYWSLETYRIHELDPSILPNVEEAINFYAPEARPIIQAAVQRAMDVGQSYDLELPFVTAQGKSIWVRTIGQAEFRDGKCLRLFGAFQDITARKQTEEALRSARDELEVRVEERTRELATANQELLNEIGERRQIEQQLRVQTTAMEAAASGIVITDRQGNIQWTNPALTHMSGYDPQQLAGQNMRVFSSGRHDAAYYRDLWDTISAGNVWRGETINRRRDGSFYIEEQTITPVRDEKSQITQFISIKQDISERKQAEQALRESEEKFRTLVEWTYDWEIWLDPAGRIVYNSPACERITGYSAGELEADPDLLVSIVHAEDRSLYRDHEHVLHDETASVDTLEYRIVARNGSEHWIEHVCRPLFDADGRYLGRRMSNRDITERKQAEEEIRERNEKEKVLTDTIHTMQLDIARDLHDTVGQNISFLRMKLDHLAESKIRKQANLQLEVQNMARVANESYDLLRGMLAVLQSVDSTDLFRLFTRYAGQIEERSGFKTEFCSRGEPKFIAGKRMRQLFYIFREILSNIEKHAHATRVALQMDWDDNSLKLVVSDNGAGFDPDAIQSAGHYGLRFMRERVELLNGTLSIRSSLGAGTVILLQVPYE